MKYRTFFPVVVSALVVLVSGCSSSRTLAPLPPGVDVRGPMPSPLSRTLSVRITEFADLPRYRNYYYPTAVAAGPDGQLWVTDTIDQDFGENVVASIATSGEATHNYFYDGVGSEGAGFQDITAGSDGALWITDTYNQQLVKLTIDGTYTNFPQKNTPLSIASGPDKALWFTAESSRGGAIGRMTTEGRITTYPLSQFAWDITPGLDGALWFTEPQADRIGRITTHGKITEYSNGITAGSYPYSIASGPDGALWFTELAGGRIGRITTTGCVTEYSRGITPSEEPNDIATGADGGLWFTEFNGHNAGAKVGRITKNGRISEYSKDLDPRSAPTGIARGSDDRMWFVESFPDRMGRIRR